MNRAYRMSRRFEKKLRGGAKPTWHECTETEQVTALTALRRLSNKRCKKEQFSGSSIKAY